MSLSRKTRTYSDQFRPKKKVGQIYVNIPGSGTIWVECDPEDPTGLNPALDAAIKLFFVEHDKLMREVRPQLVKS